MDQIHHVLMMQEFKDTSIFLKLDNNSKSPEIIHGLHAVTELEKNITWATPPFIYLKVLNKKDLKFFFTQEMSMLLFHMLKLKLILNKSDGKWLNQRDPWLMPEDLWWDGKLNMKDWHTLSLTVLDIWSQQTSLTLLMKCSKISLNQKNKTILLKWIDIYNRINNEIYFYHLWILFIFYLNTQKYKNYLVKYYHLDKNKNYISKKNFHLWNSKNMRSKSHGKINQKTNFFKGRVINKAGSTTFNSQTNLSF